MGSPYRPTTQTFRAPPARGAVGFSFVVVGNLGAVGDAPAAVAVNRLIRSAEPAFVMALGGFGTGGAGRSPPTGTSRTRWSGPAARRTCRSGGAVSGAPGGRDDLRNYKGRFASPPSGGCRRRARRRVLRRGLVLVRRGAAADHQLPRARTDLDLAPMGGNAEANSSPRPRPTPRSGTSSPPATVPLTRRGGGGNAELRAILDGFGSGSQVRAEPGRQARAYERSKPQAHVVTSPPAWRGRTAGAGRDRLRMAGLKPPPFHGIRALHHGLVKISVRPPASVSRWAAWSSAKDEAPPRRWRHQWTSPLGLGGPTDAAARRACRGPPASAGGAPARVVEVVAGPAELGHTSASAFLDIIAAKLGSRARHRGRRGALPAGAVEGDRATMSSPTEGALERALGRRVDRSGGDHPGEAAVRQRARAATTSSAPSLPGSAWQQQASTRPRRRRRSARASQPARHQFRSLSQRVASTSSSSAADHRG